MPRCSCAGNSCNCLVQAGDNVTVTGRGTAADPYVVAATGGGGGSAAWGGIGGTLSDQTDLQSALNLKAPLASPALTGNPTAPTPATSDNDTSIATTAFVKAQGYAPLASPALTGTPTAPTQTAGNNSTRLATTAFVQTAVAEARRYAGVNAQTGTTYTLVLADDGKIVTCTNASPITVTIPPSSAAAFPVGAQVDVAVLGAGMVTFVGGSGVTVNATPSLVTRAQYSAVTLIKLATDVWLAVGDLANV